MIVCSAVLLRSVARRASALALFLVLAVGTGAAQEPPAADVPAGTISVDADDRDDAAIRRRIQDILGQVEGLGGVSVSSRHVGDHARCDDILALTSSSS